MGHPRRTERRRRDGALGGTEDWSQAEVEACVADYLQMLALELAGQSYSKTAHRNALRQLLDDRSDSSVEMKHRNISAVLLELGCPHVIGYKPLANYQQRLFKTIEDRLQTNTAFDDAAVAAVEHPAIVPALVDFSLVYEAPPASRRVAEDKADYIPRFTAVKRDYLALDPAIDLSAKQESALLSTTKHDGYMR